MLERGKTAEKGEREKESETKAGRRGQAPISLEKCKIIIQSLRMAGDKMRKWGRERDTHSQTPTHTHFLCDSHTHTHFLARTHTETAKLTPIHAPTPTNNTQKQICFQVRKMALLVDATL